MVFREHPSLLVILVVALTIPSTIISTLVAIPLTIPVSIPIPSAIPVSTTVAVVAMIRIVPISATMFAWLVSITVTMFLVGPILVLIVVRV